MKNLGIDNFHVLGVSMGGMIAQQTAIDYPDNIISLTSWMSSPGLKGQKVQNLFLWKL